MSLVVASCGASVQGGPEQTGGDVLSQPTIGAPQETPTPLPEPTAIVPAVSLEGLIIALDAGHGEGDEGAIAYCSGAEILEADVNLATRALLQTHLESVDATVYLVPQPESRQERVQAAEDAGADFLLSIHHNGIDDSSINYTMTFVADDADMLLASYVHPALVEALALPNSEIQYAEFGMTSFGSLPAILTEATFITNDMEACNYITSQSRMYAEAQALFDGIVAYAVGEGLATESPVE